MSGEELLKIMQKRRSVRSYSGEAVPMEKLNLILQAGMMAPSGRAIRPWELIVIRDKQKLIGLSSCRMGGSARMLAGADLAIAVVGDEERQRRSMPALFCSFPRSANWRRSCLWGCPKRTGLRRPWNRFPLARSISTSID